MPDNKPGGLKLKLRNKADTNRLKTQTGRLKTEAAQEGAAEAQTKAVPVPPQPAMPAANQTAEIQDPMALRDTSQGKLKRVQSPDETANAVSPAAAGEDGVKRETVRLKVVRGSKPGSPQAAPGPGAPAAESAPPPAAPPQAESPAAPSAQTIKISLPGLKKGPSKAGQAALKRSTSTVRVQEPAEAAGAGSTLKVSPPKPEAEEYRETNTATLKVGVQKPAEPAAPQDQGASPAGTLKIRPAPGPADKKEDGGQSKQVTASLKVRPGADTAPPSPDTELPQSKNVTATLKIRSGDKAPEDSASTVKISLPATPAPKEEAAPTGSKPSLRLKKSDKGPEPADTVRLPGLPEEPVAEDASKTVSLSTESPEESPDEGEKKALGLKPSKSEDAESADEDTPEAMAAPASMPRPASAGPGPIAFVIRFAACGALGTLVWRLVVDFLAL